MSLNIFLKRKFKILNKIKIRRRWKRGKLDCGRKCMGNSVFLLENNEKDTARIIQTVSYLCFTYLCNNYRLRNNSLISGLSCSNK